MLTIIIKKAKEIIALKKFDMPSAEEVREFINKRSKEGSEWKMYVNDERKSFRQVFHQAF